jgi:hypothetical protein
MEAEIIDLDLFRASRPACDAVDPCSKCFEVSSCKTTCGLADAWWKQFSKKFNLGGE